MVVDTWFSDLASVLCKVPTGKASPGKQSLQVDIRKEKAWVRTITSSKISKWKSEKKKKNLPGDDEGLTRSRVGSGCTCHACID